MSYSQFVIETFSSLILQGPTTSPQDLEAEWASFEASIGASVFEDSGSEKVKSPPSLISVSQVVERDTRGMPESRLTRSSVKGRSRSYPTSSGEW